MIYKGSSSSHRLSDLYMTEIVSGLRTWLYPEKSPDGPGFFNKKNSNLSGLATFFQISQKIRSRLHLRSSFVVREGIPVQSPPKGTIDIMGDTDIKLCRNVSTTRNRLMSRKIGLYGQETQKSGERCWQGAQSAVADKIRSLVA